MKNKEAMNAAVEAALGILREGRALTPVDAGRYKTIKVYGVMKFLVDQYTLEGVGNVSVMRLNMGLPLMTMATVVVTPFEKNAPLLSADCIYMMGNRKTYIEFYDLVAERDESYRTHIAALAEIGERYGSLGSCAPAPAWYDHLLTATAYKSGKAADDETLIALLTDCVRGYMELCDAAPVLDGAGREEKLCVTARYVDGLVKQGGTSTNVFKKALGEETTRDFFGRVFFGTRRE